MARADQIRETALRLFVERGYAGTTIAAIEEAVGMSPGSGGIYRYYPSKRALLDAVLEHVLARRTETARDPRLLQLDDLPVALRAAAEGVLAYVFADRHLYLLLLRRELPLDLPAVYARVFQPGFDDVAAWLRRLARHHGGDPEQDWPAIAATELSSLLYFAVSELTYGCPPAGVSRERFVAAWVAGLAARLRSTPGSLRKDGT